jgi:rhamnopyranosyl-N-acetylglucosaminyl-diphospho-decaprenol beta-1,3/1,4-galactofuranosyltransferase
VAPPHSLHSPEIDVSSLSVAAVIVTRDRPILLRQCLGAVLTQVRPPNMTIIIDNASTGPDTQAVTEEFEGVRHIKLKENLGGAGGFRLGIILGLQAGADAIWLMDDDGRPAGTDCLKQLIESSNKGTDIAAPVVVDTDDHSRLAFPLRLDGRTRFETKDVLGVSEIEGFAHLFNGTLIKAAVFHAIGLPDPRFVIRGDEVEFLYRTLQADLKVHTLAAARFLHPGSAPEIHPIMFGIFYATVPNSDFKAYHQFRNRGYIFRAYGMWIYLFADIIRYGWFFIISSGFDARGLWHWLTATATGWRGKFMEGDADLRRPKLLAELTQTEGTHVNG